MRTKLMIAVGAVGAFGLAMVSARLGLAQTPSGLDTAAIEQATGLKGQLIAEENVFKVTKPRSDVKIQVDQWTMPPFMGLGSWAAFTPAHGGAMLMGDTVVFEDEVNPAMSAALDAGLEVTALHNHFFFDKPRVFFMHIGGHGDVKALAAGVKKVYDKIAEIRAANPSPTKSFLGTIASPNSISAAPLEAALGVKGQSNQGMFKIVIGRAASMNGYVVRANALEDNVVLYKTVNSVRSSLDLVGQKGGYGVKTAVPANQWHTLRVEFAGARFNVVFNDKPLFAVEDSTFSEAGMVGLWTKADSVTLFRGFTYGERR